jgi:HlyD family secretion protein
MLKWISALILACAMAVSFYWWWHDADVKITYVTAPIERGRLSEIITATGKLEALVTVEISSEVSGQIAELFVDFNDTVKEGQPLAQIDRQSFEARFADAEAAVKIAQAAVNVRRARLERARVDIVEAKLQRAVYKARVDYAKARLVAAQSDLTRKKPLNKSGTITDNVIEQVRGLRDARAASFREAEAQAMAHEQNIVAAETDYLRTKAELASAMATVPQKRALLNLAAVELERTTIRSPVNGVVIDRSIDKGQTVAAALEAPVLFTIAGDLRNMVVHVRVDETDIGRIQIGQKASFEVDAFPDQKLLGTVSDIRKAAQIVQNVVTYTVVVQTTNPKGNLLPGMTALVKITISSSSQLLIIPTAALDYTPSIPALTNDKPAESVIEGRSNIAWRLGANGKPEPVTIGTGASDLSSTALLSGPLAEGDLVIINEIQSSARSGLFGIRLGF